MLFKADSIAEQRRMIFRISVPIVINGLFQQLQMLIDRAFLGNQNSAFFAAIGNVFYPYTITMAVVWAITIGTTILVSQSLGAEKEDDAHHYSGASLKYNSILGGLLFLFWFLFSRTVFEIMTVQEPILTYSIQYVRLLSFSLLILGLESTSASILQATGNTKPILYAGLLRNGLNIFLDWLLIQGNWGFPRLGLEGAAIATSISNFVAGLVLLYFTVFYRKRHLKLRLRNIVLSKFKVYWEVIKLGIPASLEELLWNLGALVLVFFMNQISPMSAGIYTLILGIELIPIHIIFCFSKAATVLVGNKTGENDIPGAIKIAFMCLRYAIVVCLIFSGINLIFSELVLRIFSKEADLIEQAVPFLTIVSLTFYPKAINFIMGSSIRGYGDTKWMLYTQIIGTTFVITSAYFLIYEWDLGLYGVFFTIMADEIVRGALNTIRFLRGKRPFWGEKRVFAYTKV